MRWVRLSLKIAGLVVLSALLLFAGLAIYVSVNKDKVFRLITDQLQDNLSGTLAISKMRPSLAGFPGISVLMQDVTLRDSLWSRHGRTLLTAKEVYVSINALALLKGEARLRDIRIRDGAVCFFTDSTGYSNTQIFRKRADEDTLERKRPPRFGDLRFEQVSFTVEHHQKHKLFQYYIKELTAVSERNNGLLHTRLGLSTYVRSMAFNTDKGSFLKDKWLTAELNVTYNERTKTLDVPWNKVRIGADVVQVKGQFIFDRNGAFTLFLNVNGIMYKNVLDMMTPGISKHLTDFDMSRPVDAQAVLKGRTKYRDTPQVVIRWQVRDNTFITPAGTVEHCTYTGRYNNEREKGAGHKDNNGLITLQDMTGNWKGIPFRADTVSISDLIDPVVQGRFTSRFDVTKLNQVTGGNTFRFDKGLVDVDVLYKGGLRRHDTTFPYIVGSLKLSGATATYVPRALRFTNCGATLRFAGSDLYVDKVRLQRGATRLEMDGTMANFLQLYYRSPEKIILDWRVYSPHLDLAEFIPFIGIRGGSPSKEEKNANASRTSDQLDKMLAASSVRLQVKADKLVFRSFEGSALTGQAVMASTGIHVNGLSVRHGGGKLKIDADVQQQGAINDYHLKAEADRVNIRHLFAAFENFGQTAITDKQIDGRLSAKADVVGAVQDNGQLVPYSINGSVSFRYDSGTLVGFEPMKLIGSFIFRRRDMDSITIGTIDNKFAIRGDRILIYPLDIRSSAFNMKIEGTYVVGRNGTDINIDVPLRDPKKDELTDEVVKQDRPKGLVLHLKATDANNGKVKIKWNPTNRPPAREALPRTGPATGQ